jgi:hypothetical protein
MAITCFNVGPIHSRIVLRILYLFAAGTMEQYRGGGLCEFAKAPICAADPPPVRLKASYLSRYGIS